MAAVAVFNQSNIIGTAIAHKKRAGTHLCVEFQKLPVGAHGFHIHTAGDLRGTGCAGACSHWHIGAATRHGDAPGHGHERHTGDLGNIYGPTWKRSYFLADVSPSDLWGRTLIVHADEDDLGLGGHEDSGTTGHSGARIGCALFGRAKACTKTRKHTKSHI